MVTIRAWFRIGLIAVGLVFSGTVVSAQDGPAVPDNPQTFNAWLADLRTEALDKGISGDTFDKAFAGVKPIPHVIELDRKQPEFTQTYEDYIADRVTRARIDLGRKKIVQYRKALKAVGKKYGVQPRFIAAIWGLETNYGSFSGSYSVIASLATLAYDQRRPAYFRKELLNALKILDEGNTTPDKMKGSWAGAMGQSQFMPSSFLAFAQDYNGDGKRDIWNTPVDVFASIAYYLKVNGWADDHTWGRRVRIPNDFAAQRANLMPKQPPASCRRALKSHTMRVPLSNWEALGVRDQYGNDLPKRPGLLASLVTMDDGKGPSYLTYPNFRVILSYNCSNFYALAVGQLSDALAPALRDSYQ